MVVGLTTCQGIGGEVKRLHDEPNRVNDVDGNRSRVADTGGAEALNGDRHFNRPVHEDVIHDRAVGLDPLVGCDGGVADGNGLDREVIVRSTPTRGGLSGNNHVHGEGLHQEQHDNGEGHHSAHGHQQLRPTRLSIRRSPFDGLSRRSENHRSSPA